MCNNRNWRGLAALIVGLSTLAGSAQAAPFLLYGGGGEYSVPVKSMLDKRYNGVNRQKYDFSCGSAAMATLLSQFYGYAIDEGDVLNAMYEVGDQETIKQKGFSLLDMKKYLASIGYKAEGYRTPIDKLVKANIPAIALINHRGYSHFVVVAGVVGDSVLLLDSAKGKKVISKSEFEDQWNGILFIIHDDMKFAGKSFNTKNQWASHLQSRFNVSLNDRDLASTALHTTYNPGYY